MIGKLGEVMKKLQEMKKISEDMKKKLDEMTIEYSSDDGKFQCTMNGNRILTNIFIDPSLKNLSHEEFQKKLLNYLNNALLKAQQETEAEIKKAAKDFMPDLPF